MTVPCLAAGLTNARAAAAEAHELYVWVKVVMVICFQYSTGIGSVQGKLEKKFPCLLSIETRRRVVAAILRARARVELGCRVLVDEPLHELNRIVRLGQ